MRASRLSVAAVFALLSPVVLLSAQNPQLKITIRGAGLPSPVEITDHDMLVKFFFGSGPGNRSSDGRNYSAVPSFIVDWPLGAVTEPSKELPSYEVEFLTSRTGLNTYRVTYAWDPVTQQGYVYLPGASDPRYRENTWLLLRGIEGHWFRAWSDWDAAVKPLLPSGR